MLKVALVTGAGTGIGKSAALALLKDGYSVALVGRRKELLEKTAAESGAKDRCLVLAADLSQPAAVKDVYSQLKAKWNRLDVLFNNAGIGAPPVPLDELPIETWRQVVDVNLTGVFLCCREAMRLMKAQRPKGGRIINNGSLSAHVPRPLSAPYTATKHAITGLTRSLALDGRADGIACSQIDIGNAATPMTEPMAAGARQPDGSMRPEPRMDVAHVAIAVLMMANLPLETNVLFLTIKATAMPYEGRG
jgi:NAD(P)-dependent dehydrogenase (short-subunit alcohol dehydrogenase family)